MTITVKSESGMEVDHHVPHDKHLLVHSGDYVDAGTPLTDGPLVPHDILRIRGEEALQRYLLNEIQGVYRAQKQNINAGSANQLFAGYEAKGDKCRPDKEASRCRRTTGFEIR